MNHESNSIIVGYFPVIHRGYIDLITKYPDASVAVFDTSIISKFDYLRKDIRALSPDQAVKIIEGIGTQAFTISMSAFDTLLAKGGDIIMIDDDVSHSITKKYPNRKPTIQFESTFLRWDRLNTSTDLNVVVDRTVSSAEIQVDHKQLFNEAERSTDWWRLVAAGLIENNSLTLTHNRAMPHEYVNFIDGDPRITENRGTGIEKSLFIHAEADLIAHMAKEGLSTNMKSIFVTTFPCPNCAKLIAASGFKTCYFVDGYAMLDGQRILKDAGVEIVKIAVSTPYEHDTSRLRTYPEKT